MRFHRHFFTVIFGLVFSHYALALDPVYSNLFGTAIKGYDPVAYFEQGEPQKGSRDYAYEWNGATWHFSSQENQNRFAKDPAAFAPQYGGYCA